ncbi:hypothetical protein BR93DRAFT_380490 [Coniochaeta sp. PMI_546]|nr:hypothetical protein BR93DRAFT_380490 [Coniochaeta sp. PMI_546]
MIFDSSFRHYLFSCCALQHSCHISVVTYGRQRRKATSSTARPIATGIRMTSHRGVLVPEWFLNSSDLFQGSWKSSMPTLPGHDDPSVAPSSSQKEKPAQNHFGLPMQIHVHVIVIITLAGTACASLAVPFPDPVAHC